MWGPHPGDKSVNHRRLALGGCSALITAYKQPKKKTKENLQPRSLFQTVRTDAGQEQSPSSGDEGAFLLGVKSLLQVVFGGQ